MNSKKIIGISLASAALLGGLVGVGTHVMKGSSDSTQLSSSKADSPTVSDPKLNAAIAALQKMMDTYIAQAKTSKLSQDEINKNIAIGKNDIDTMITRLKGYFAAKDQIKADGGQIQKTFNLDQIKAGDFSSLQGEYKESNIINYASGNVDGSADLLTTNVNTYYEIINSKLYTFDDMTASKTDPGLILDGKVLTSLTVYDLSYGGVQDGKVWLNPVRETADSTKAPADNHSSVPQPFKLVLFPAGQANPSAHDYSISGGNGPFNLANTDSSVDRLAAIADLPGRAGLVQDLLARIAPSQTTTN